MRRTQAALRYPAPMLELSFRPLVRDDFPLLSRWLAEPHVAKWWCSPSDMAYVEQEYGPAIDGTDPTELFILQIAGQAVAQPIGLFQRYLLDDYPDWAAAVGFPGAAGIDYLIGEPGLVGQGIGSRAIRAFSADVLARYPDANAVVAAPQQANFASWKALERAGFGASLGRPARIRRPGRRRPGLRLPPAPLMPPHGSRFELPVCPFVVLGIEVRGERKADLRAAAIACPRPHAAALRFHQPLADRKPQANSGRLR